MFSRDHICLYSDHDPLISFDYSVSEQLLFAPEKRFVPQSPRFCGRYGRSYPSWKAVDDVCAFLNVIKAYLWAHPLEEIADLFQVHNLRVQVQVLMVQVREQVQVTVAQVRVRVQLQVLVISTCTRTRS